VLNILADKVVWPNGAQYFLIIRWSSIDISVHELFHWYHICWLSLLNCMPLLISLHCSWKISQFPY